MKKVTLRIEIRAPRSPLARARRLMAWALGEMRAGRLRRAAELLGDAAELTREQGAGWLEQLARVPPRACELLQPPRPLLPGELGGITQELSRPTQAPGAHLAERPRHQAPRPLQRRARHFNL